MKRGTCAPGTDTTKFTESMKVTVADVRKPTLPVVNVLVDKSLEVALRLYTRCLHCYNSCKVNLGTTFARKMCGYCHTEHKHVLPRKNLKAT